MKTKEKAKLAMNTIKEKTKMAVKTKNNAKLAVNAEKVNTMRKQS